MDWIRAFYYIFMTKTGLADTYRNEQYFPKSDYFYDLERNLIAINFGNPDKSKLSLNIIIALRYRVQFLIDYLMDRYDKKEEEEALEEESS